MARGWESKSVESQQADREASASKGPRPSAADAADAARRQTIAVSLARARADLTTATNPNHRRMLEGAIAALTEQLQGAPEALEG